MAFTPLELGLAGGLCVFVVRESFSLVGKFVDKKNGNGKNNLIPGDAQVCQDRALKITEHDVVIKHLCEDAEIKRKKLDRDLERIFNVLDSIRKSNGG